MVACRDERLVTTRFVGNRVCDVQAAVLCCAVAAEAPKNRKKIWKKNEQSQWSAVSHQTDAAAAEYHPLITDWSQPVCCCVCATSFGFGPITAALNNRRCPNSCSVLACLCLILPPCRRCRRTSGLWGLPRSARAAPPFK